MRIHAQRKLVFDTEPPEMEDLDLSVFDGTDDIAVGVIGDEGGLWLMIIQEAITPLDEIPILPGFHRITTRMLGANRATKH